MSCKFKFGYISDLSEDRMKFIDDIDNRLFDHIFEPFSGWFQRLTGLTCFRLAKWCCVLVVLFYILFSVTNSLKGDWQIMELSFCSVTFILWFFCAVICEKKEKQFAKSPGTANEDRYSQVLVFVRCAIGVAFINTILVTTLFCIWFGMVGNNMVARMAMSLFFLSIVCFQYFSACTPLVPKQSKIRKWLERAMKEPPRERATLSP